MLRKLYIGIRIITFFLQLHFLGFLGVSKSQQISDEISIDMMAPNHVLTRKRSNPVITAANIHGPPQKIRRSMKHT